MVIRGHIENGVVVLDEPVALPDGARVQIELIAEPAPDGGETKSLFERLEGVIGKAQGLPADAATNVDHYLYGHPKR